MFKRLLNLWRLSKLEPEGFKWTGTVQPVDMDPSIKMVQVYPPVEGDGKAEFLPDMTEEEVLEYERNERLGWKDFIMPWQKKNGPKQT